MTSHVSLLLHSVPFSSLDLQLSGDVHVIEAFYDWVVSRGMTFIAAVWTDGCVSSGFLQWWCTLRGISARSKFNRWMKRSH